MPDFTPTTTEAEKVCREYAAEFPTPNVLRAIAHAEAGDCTWEAIGALFARALHAAVASL